MPPKSKKAASKKVSDHEDDPAYVDKRKRNNEVRLFPNFIIYYHQLELKDFYLF
jgi:hypothetical protein